MRALAQHRVDPAEVGARGPAGAQVEDERHQRQRGSDLADQYHGERGTLDALDHHQIPVRPQGAHRAGPRSTTAAGPDRGAGPPARRPRPVPRAALRGPAPRRRPALPARRQGRLPLRPRPRDDHGPRGRRAPRRPARARARRASSPRPPPPPAPSWRPRRSPTWSSASRRTPASRCTTSEPAPCAHGPEGRAKDAELGPDCEVLVQLVARVDPQAVSAEPVGARSHDGAALGVTARVGLAAAEPAQHLGALGLGDEAVEDLVGERRSGHLHGALAARTARLGRHVRGDGRHEKRARRGLDRARPVVGHGDVDALAAARLDRRLGREDVLVDDGALPAASKSPLREPAVPAALPGTVKMSWKRPLAVPPLMVATIGSEPPVGTWP